MERKMRTLSQPAVLWLQVCGLAGAGAITLTWVITCICPSCWVNLAFPSSWQLITNFRKCVGSGDGTTDGWIVRSDQALDGESVYLSRGSAVIGIVYRYSICCHFGKQAAVSRCVAGGVSGLGVSNDGVRSPAISLALCCTSSVTVSSWSVNSRGGVIGASADRKSIRSELGSSFTFAIGSFVLLGRQLFCGGLIPALLHPQL